MPYNKKILEPNIRTDLSHKNGTAVLYIPKHNLNKSKLITKVNVVTTEKNIAKDNTGILLFILYAVTQLSETINIIDVANA